MTTGGTGGNANQPFTESGTPSSAGQGGSPRSTLISRLKLAGECVGNGRGGRQNAPTGGACQLTAEMGNKANVAIKGTQVQLSRTADGVWSCHVRPVGVNGGGTTASKGWKDKFIPSGCTRDNGAAGNGGWI